MYSLSVKENSRSLRVTGTYIFIVSAACLFFCWVQVPVCFVTFALPNRFATSNRQKKHAGLDDKGTDCLRST